MKKRYALIFIIAVLNLCVLCFFRYGNKQFVVPTSEFLFQHNYWSEKIQLNDGKFCRSNGDCASYQWIDDEHMLVKWENWGTEFFKKKDSTLLLLKPRILGLMSTYKRPIFASGQVLRLMNQSYPIHLSVSIKGVPDDFVKNVLEPEWKKYMDVGRLFLRIDKNREQFSNFLDTVRNIDLKQYDLFCKIDDDDFYGPNYFENLVKELKPNQKFGISYSRNIYTIDEGDKSVLIKKYNDYPLLGPSMCFSRKMIELFFVIEKNPEKLKEYLPDHEYSEYATIREDAAFHHLSAAVMGEYDRETPPEDLVVGRQYSSVTRGNYLR